MGALATVVEKAQVPERSRLGRLGAVLTALSMCLGSYACSRRVNLSVPPPSASYQERCAAYHRLRPTAMWRTTAVGRSGGNIHNDEMWLGDDIRVNVFEDLLPIVLPESETARAIHDADRYLFRQQIYSGGAGVGLLTSLALLSQDQDELALGALVGTIALAIVGYQYKVRGDDSRVRVGTTLDASLRDKLQIQGGCK